MKKIILIAAALLSLAACTKKISPSGDAIVGGNEYYSSSNARNYMMSIADDLVTGALDELESAFTIDQMGANASIHFDISKGSILTEGVSWTVTGRDRALKGMSLENTGSDTWELTYNGYFSLQRESYPVYFILKAKRGNLVKGSHYNWAVTLNGNRTERSGYACSFKTSATVLYQCKGNNTVGWNYMEGSYLLTVYKDEAPVDLWLMEFNGNPYDAHFTTGL